MSDGGPLCFVLMPFGTKQEPSGRVIEFDRVYDEIIRPAVEAEGMHCLRADEEQVGGIIHKPMFERLLLCEYAVADLSAANANVYYELGIRHAARPWSTVLAYADGFRLPFDLGPMRGVRYALAADGVPIQPADDMAKLRSSLAVARARRTDSPLFQLCAGLQPLDLSGLDSERFQARAATVEQVREKLASAHGSTSAVSEVRDGLGDLQDADPGVLVDLLLSYRGVNAFEQMIDLIEQIPPEIASNATVREQRALALNRLGRGAEAEAVLLNLLEERGPSSETLGLLGRVYKDRWEEALADGRVLSAAAFLDKAIGSYLKGFETDWRDPYPGINAIQLIWLRDRDDPRLPQLLPVVGYSTRQRIRAGSGSYWDHATMVELALYDGDMDSAMRRLGRALASRPTQMEAESTLETVGRLRHSLERPATTASWDTLERELAEAAGTSGGDGR